MKVLQLAGGLCLAYYIIIIMYAGMKVSFSKFWLVAGSIGILIPCIDRIKIRYVPDLYLPASLRAAGAVMMMAAALLCGTALFCIFRGMRCPVRENLDYVIVLGAQVKGTRPSRSLRFRMDTAVQYMKRYPASKAVLSGGQGPGEDISEAEAMKRYLMKNGISERRLLLEDQSVNTVQNLDFSARKINIKECTVGIVSNSFHICRSIKIAEKLGYADVSAVPAPTGRILFCHLVVREMFALIKDKIKGNI